MNAYAREIYNAALQLDRAREKRRLTSISHAGTVRNVLEDFAAREATVYVWLVMPDHIHLMFSPLHAFSGLDTYLGRIKHRINEQLQRRRLPQLSWREGVINHPVTWADAASARDYILQNPVRGLLVQRVQDWPHHNTPAALPGL